MFRILVIFILFLQAIYAQSFQIKATSKINLLQKGNEKTWCPVSGYNLKDFYKLSSTSKLPNGFIRQYASFYFMVEDKKEYGFDIKTLKVLDVESEKYIAASKAHFLINSKIKGIVFKSAILAFKNELVAKEFSLKYDGKVVNFDEAMIYANKNYEIFSKKYKTIKEKKIYPKGKKIFEKLCKSDLDSTLYIEINELKSAMINENLCKKMGETNLQLAALYLWDVKRFPENIIGKVEVLENERCPVCAMFVAKYPRWAAQIFYKNGHHHSFDGVKDLMKFYFNPSRWGDYKISHNDIEKVLVTDYYTQKGIDGKKAYYVVGSDTYGPMGHELIPFESLDDAKVFKADHGGTLILKFNEITEEGVYKLDVL